MGQQLFNKIDDYTMKKMQGFKKNALFRFRIVDFGFRKDASALCTEQLGEKRISVHEKLL
jgi:hypothetical protein